MTPLRVEVRCSHDRSEKMHRDLMNALLPILPRKIYRDRSRVVNLVWPLRGGSSWQARGSGVCTCEVHTHGHATSVSVFAFYLSSVILFVELG